jgi:hypothetical protein
MSTHGDGGKGSAPLPIPDPQKFRDNWDAIFGRKPKAEDSPDKKKEEKPK